jgi:ankyrin repeat protein
MPLSKACRVGFRAVVKRLLEAGADPNVQCRNDGEPTLYRASKYGYQSIAKLLLHYGATAEELEVAHC